MAKTKITALADGPYQVSGGVEVYDSAGKVVETTGQEDVFLCRCGGSQNKPFCDGVHAKIGFAAAEAAVAALEEKKQG